MKKSKSIKSKENIQSKTNNEKNLYNESEKKILLKKNNNNKKNFRKKQENKTNIKTIMTETSESLLKTKESKEISKHKKSNLIINNKSKNKTLENLCGSNIKKSKTKKLIKKNKNDSGSISYSLKRKRVKNSYSLKNFNKSKNTHTSKFSLTKYNTSRTSNLENNRSDSTNNLLLGSDNFIKSLLSKYLDGTDNIINEDLEQFNIIENNEDNGNLSFFNEKNDNDNDNNKMKESMDIKKSLSNIEDKKNKSNNNINVNNTINNNSNNINSSKVKKKIPDIIMNSKCINNNKTNQIKSNIYNSLMNSPNRIIENRLTMRSQTALSTLYKKNMMNIPQKKKSFSKPKKKVKLKEKEKDKENISTNESKESKLKRKILYSNKIINSLNKSKKNNKNNEIEQKNRETIPASASSLNLDIIFENNNIPKIEPVSHHYLEYTVSTKNKIVQKKNMNSYESKNVLSSFNKIEEICEINDKNSNQLRKTILRVNRTPKVKKDLKANERYSLNNFNTNNNINSTRNYLRKNSHNINRELSGEHNISGMSTMINSKIFNGKIDDYLITKELGKGSYAVVKLAVHKTTKNKYAIKIYSKRSLIDPQKRSTVKNEINILKQIDNENVMKLYEVIDTPSNLYLVLEYIKGINLLEIMKNEKYHFLKEERAKKIFLQIVKGISYCHKKNIYHRDIKLENILVLKDDTVKIIDFGFSVKCNRDSLQKLFCGTPAYMPPEIVKKEKYMACYSDVWSLGVLFYALLFGIFPFKGKDEDDLFEKIKEANLTFPEYNEINEKTKELFEKIFVKIPNQRISLDEIINILNNE